MKIESNSTLLFVGDSITDAGRARPVGEGLNGQLGTGYVHLAASHLSAFHAEKRIRVLNTGVGGDTVRELARRWQQDVLDLRPDYVSVMIGINDSWRHFGQFWDDALLVSVEEYKGTLRRLVDETLPRVKGLVLMTPYFFAKEGTDAMRASIDEYRAAMKAVAAEKQVECFDTQSAIDRTLAHLHPCMLADDRVHPRTNGHMILARAFLEGAELW